MGSVGQLSSAACARLHRLLAPTFIVAGAGNSTSGLPERWLYADEPEGQTSEGRRSVRSLPPCMLLSLTLTRFGAGVLREFGARKGAAMVTRAACG